MTDTPDTLPPWVPLAGGIALAVLLLSGAGILLIEAVTSRPQPTATAPPAADRPTRVPAQVTAPPDPTPTPPPENALTLGQPQSATLTHQQPTHTYTLRAERGDLLTVELTRPPESPTQADLRLYDPNGIQIGDAPLLRAIRTQLALSGVYTLEVAGRSGYTLGEYTITARRASPDEVPLWQILLNDESAWAVNERATLVVGQERRRLLTAPTQADAWQLSVDDGQVLRVSVEGDAHLVLRDRADFISSPVALTYDGQAEFVFRAIRDGTYTVWVLPDAPQPPDGTPYTLRVEELPPNETFTQYRRGVVTFAGQGRIISAAQRDRWPFSGQAGQRVIIYTTADQPPTLEGIDLLGPGGEVMPPEARYRGGLGVESVYVLPVTGVYQYEVSGSDTWSDYVVGINTIEGEFYTDYPAELTTDTNTRATLTGLQDLHTYTFPTEAGQRYALTLERLTEDDDSLRLVVQPPGEAAPLEGVNYTETSPTRLVFTAAQAGVAEVTVESGGGGLLGQFLTYTLRLEETSPFEPQSVTWENFNRVYEDVLRPGQSEIGTLDRADHAHDWLITHDAPTRRTITVEVEGRGGMIPCLLDEFTPRCPGAGGSLYQKVLSIPPGGPYRVRLVPHFAQTGNYLIRATEGTPPLQLPEAATPLAFGVEAAANPAGYTFPAEADTPVAFIVRPQAPRLDLALFATGPSGEGLTFQREATGHYPHVVPMQSGMGLLRVEGESSAYTVEMVSDFGAPIERQGTLSLGDDVARHMSDGYLTHRWDLTVEPGQQLTLHLDTFAVGTVPGEVWMRVVGESLTQADRQVFVAEEGSVTFTPTEGYTYRVVIFQGASEPLQAFNQTPPPLDYRLRVREGLGFAIVETASLRPGEQAEGRIRLPLEAGRWLVTAEEGDRVTVQLDSTRYTLIVTDANGRILENTGGTTRAQGVLTFEAPRDGAYAVYVTRFDDGSGFYTIEIKVR